MMISSVSPSMVSQANPLVSNLRANGLTPNKAILAATDALKAKLEAAPSEDMGGCTLTLTPDEANHLREMLGLMADQYERGELWGSAIQARALRKRIAAQVVRNCERRTTPAVEIGDEGAIL